jgi:hypothetical protein
MTDFNARFFAYDEHTDFEDEKAVRSISDTVLDALYHPERPRPVGESPLGEIARQYVLLFDSVLNSPLTGLLRIGFGFKA